MQLEPLPELEYDERRGQPLAPTRLAARLAEALTAAGLSPEDSVLHVHNHALGKSVALPPALAQLADRGWAVLLQVHDFAEDFRPYNFGRLRAALAGGDTDRLPSEMYPQAPRIHYATLNGRDERLLAAAGVPPQRLHCLPNPVAAPGEPSDPSGAREKLVRLADLPAHDRWFVYPVRGIRRKNLGEMLLLSAVWPEPATFAITLRPLNPLESASYDRWRQLAEKLKLPCRFSLGEVPGVPFVDLLAAADALLTTSVAEGFGMVFLEASLVGRPLLGRDLPEITADFRQAGVQLPWLSPRWSVPLSATMTARAQSHLTSVYEEVAGEFAVPAAARVDAEQAIEEMFADRSIDFASLAPEQQADVIREVASDPQGEFAQALRPPEHWSGVSHQQPQVAEVLAGNAQAITRAYGLAASAERLRSIYAQVLGSDATGDREPLAHGDRILKFFLHPRRLHPIRLHP